MSSSGSGYNDEKVVVAQKTVTKTTKLRPAPKDNLPVEPPDDLTTLPSYQPPAPTPVREKPPTNYHKKISWWKQNPDREKALHKFFQGMSIKNIAKELQYATSTISAWVNDVRFVRRLETMLKTTSRQRQFQRMHATGRVTNFLQMKIDQAIRKEMDAQEEAKRHQRDLEPEDDQSDAVARLLKTYALARAEERKDLQSTEMRMAEEVMQGASVTEVTETEVVQVIARSLGDKRLGEVDSALKEELGIVEGEFVEVEDVPRGRLIGLLDEVLDDPEVLSGFHRDYDDAAGIGEVRQEDPTGALEADFSEYDEGGEDER